MANCRVAFDHATHTTGLYKAVTMRPQMTLRAVAVWLLCLVALHVWFWTSTVVDVHTEEHTLHARTSAAIFNTYSWRYDIPRTHVILRGEHRRMRILETTHGDDDWLALHTNVTHWSAAARPVSGDHIHMAMSIWIHGTPREQAEHDRPPLEAIDYEQKPAICPNPGTVAYDKVWPHAGVHTHCDGLIHVHPWSAPRVLRQEGLRIRLGLWFDQVGIRYRQHPLSLAFPDGARFVNNATHRWRVAEYRCFRETEPVVYTEQLDHIWLGHAYASYVMWFGTRSTPPPAIASHIEALKRVGAHGFDGNPYPQQCI